MPWPTMSACAMQSAVAEPWPKASTAGGATKQRVAKTASRNASLNRKPIVSVVSMVPSQCSFGPNPEPTATGGRLQASPASSRGKSRGHNGCSARHLTNEVLSQPIHASRQDFGRADRDPVRPANSWACITQMRKLIGPLMALSRHSCSPSASQHWIQKRTVCSWFAISAVVRFNCSKNWRLGQSSANLSPPRISLFVGKIQGNFGA